MRIAPLLFTSFLLASALVVPTRAVRAEAILLRTITGQQVTGQLVEWNDEAVEITTDDGLRTVPLEQLLDLERPATDDPASRQPTPMHLRLADGSRLPIERFAAVQREVTVRSPLAQEPLTLQASKVRWVNFSQNPAHAAALEQHLVEKQPTEDVLAIYTGSGESVDFLAGILGDVTADSLQFQWDGERIPIKRSKVAALAYYSSGTATLPDPVCRIRTTSGAVLAVKSAQLKGTALDVTTTSDLALQIQLADVEDADFSLGKLVYLSDLQPVRQQWVPLVEIPASAELIQQYGAPRTDSSFSGSALSLTWPHGMAGSKSGRKSYSRGLALRSRTELEYRLPDDMRRFVALAGIDPQTAHEGHVDLELSGDGKVLFREPIVGNDPPVEIDLDITKVRKLRIVVDYGENLDFGDQLHLVEARVIK